MGHFKAVKRKKRRVLRIIYLFIILIIIVLVTITCKMKMHIKSDTLNRLLGIYMQVDFKTAKAQKVLKKTLHQSEELSQSSLANSEPVVYIYNTHQQESYAYLKANPYNVSYDVLFASQILKAYLDEQGIISLIEPASISNLLKEKKFVYAQSYEITRKLLEEAKEKYPSLNYYVDLHRDSSPYEVTTCEIDQQKYARILFVIGLEHANYAQNRLFVKTLDNFLQEQNKCLSRGIMEKAGEGVNGVYNQDFDAHVMLIEVGGQYNTIDEVNRSLKVFSDVLTKYIKETI